MEKRTVQIQSEAYPPIERARFLDGIDEQYEQMWQSIVSLARETGDSVEEALIPVWLDRSVPSIFRDRAMLLALGNRTLWNKLEDQRWGGNMAFVFSCPSIETFKRVVGRFDVQLFYEWINEARSFQESTGEALFPKSLYLRWYYDCVSHGSMSEAELDELVSTIDIGSYSPTHESVSGFSEEEPRELDPERFPLLSDILHTRLNAGLVSTDAHTVRIWALRHLNRWLAYQADPSLELPVWLAKVPLETGQRLFADLVDGGRKVDGISWDDLYPAIDYFGLSIVADVTKCDGFNGVYVANRISDKKVREQFLKILLSRQNEAALAGKYRPCANGAINNVQASSLLERMVADTEDPELKSLYEIELRHTQEYRQIEREDEERRQLERRISLESDPKYQDRQLARKALVEYLHTVTSRLRQ